MKIIRSSKEKNIAATKKFTCEKCGCEFECNEDEYWDKSANTLSWGTYKTYMTCCPECHKVVEENEPCYTCTVGNNDIYTTNTINTINTTGSWTTLNSSMSNSIDSNCCTSVKTIATPTITINGTGGNTLSSLH